MIHANKTQAGQQSEVDVQVVESIKWVISICLFINFFIILFLFHPVEQDSFLTNFFIIVLIPILHFLYHLNISNRSVIGSIILYSWYIYNNLLKWKIETPILLLSAAIVMFEVLVLYVYFFQIKHVAILYLMSFVFMFPMGGDDNLKVFLFLIALYSNDLFQLIGKVHMNTQDLTVLYIVLFQIPSGLAIFYFVFIFTLQIYIIMHPAVLLEEKIEPDREEETPEEPPNIEVIPVIIPTPPPPAPPPPAASVLPMKGEVGVTGGVTAAKPAVVVGEKKEPPLKKYVYVKPIYAVGRKKPELATYTEEAVAVAGGAGVGVAGVGAAYKGGSAIGKGLLEHYKI